MLHGFSIHCPGSAQPPTMESVIHSRLIVNNIKIFDQEFNEEFQCLYDQYDERIQQSCEPTTQKRLI